MRAGNPYASADARRRLVKVRAKRVAIDPARLAEVAGDSKIKSRKIPALFGWSPTSFFVYLSLHPDLWDVYEEARRRAGFKVAHMQTTRGGLDGDDLKIIEAITSGQRTVTEIAQFAKFDLRSFASRLYNLENERHEIWSTEVGHVTHYFLRDEELSAGCEEQSVKGVAA